MTCNWFGVWAQIAEELLYDYAFYLKKIVLLIFLEGQILQGHLGAMRITIANHRCEEDRPMWTNDTVCLFGRNSTGLHTRNKYRSFV